MELLDNGKRAKLVAFVAAEMNQSCGFVVVCMRDLQADVFVGVVAGAENAALTEAARVLAAACRMEGADRS